MMNGIPTATPAATLTNKADVQAQTTLTTNNKQQQQHTSTPINPIASSSPNCQTRPHCTRARTRSTVDPSNTSIGWHCTHAIRSYEWPAHFEVRGVLDRSRIQMLPAVATAVPIQAFWLVLAGFQAHQDRRSSERCRSKRRRRRYPRRYLQVPIRGLVAERWPCVPIVAPAFRPRGSVA